MTKSGRRLWLSTLKIEGFMCLIGHMLTKNWIYYFQKIQKKNKKPIQSLAPHPSFRSKFEHVHCFFREHSLGKLKVTIDISAFGSWSKDELTRVLREAVADEENFGKSPVSPETNIALKLISRKRKSRIITQNIGRDNNKKRN